MMQNPYVSGMSQADFLERNFVIVEDLSKFGIVDGNLTVRLKFEKPLEENLIFLSLPLTKRDLIFSETLSVHIQ